MDPGSPATTTTPQSEDEECLTRKEFLCIDKAIRREDMSVLEKYVKPNAKGDIRRVNLSEDPLLNVMIGYGSNDDILLKLISMTTANNLKAENNFGDTALHVAAAKDRWGVATALLAKNPDLKEMRNDNLETPLLKAALSGSAKTFDVLYSCGSDIGDRTIGGATVLHCAISGNNPALASQIAQDHESLIYSRNWNALTPLQVMVTIPNVFQSSELGPAESLIYSVIPLNSRNESKEHKGKRDEEAFAKSKPSKYWVEDDKDNIENDKHLPKSEATYSSKRILKECRRYVAKGIFEVQCFFIFILKKLFKRVEELEKLKKNHVQTMKLIAYLARDPNYWDFIIKGMGMKHQTKTEFILEGDEPQDDDDDDENDYRNAPKDDSNQRTTSGLLMEICLILKQVMNLKMEENNLIEKPKKDDEPQDDDDDDDDENDYRNAPEDDSNQRNLMKLKMEANNLIKELKKGNMSTRTLKPEKKQSLRWHESPLIIGAKMGLHDFVEQILKVYPQSAQSKDMEGNNVLQVAIKHGQVKTVKIIAGMIRGPNPVLPSWLLSESDNMKNTILHYAAETTSKGERFALQMQREMEWFETVKKLVPKDFESSRNGEEMTAQELFNKKHAEMVKDGRKQLMELGKTCSGLLAAVVFATSFNIPGVKDSGSSTGPSNNNNMTNSTHERNHVNDESVGFKVFTHAYVIGLSFATCSLVLFLSLLTSNYRPEAFRKSLPTKYILAGVSFFFALLAFLVAFTCNVYLSIYGGGTPKAKNLLPLVLELAAFPFLCAVVLFLGGFGVRFSDFILRILHR